MPWLETTPVSERMKLVGAYDANVMTMTALSRQLGVSRKTAYKWVKRVQQDGLSGLFDRPRIAKHQSNRTPAGVEKLLVALKRKHPKWGPKKLVKLLRKRSKKRLSAASASRILKRHGLVEPVPQRRRVIRRATPLAEATAPNEVWCIDFKGQFQLQNGRSCYPLTITDNYSRMILRCTALKGIDEAPVRQILEETFAEFGLPSRIRSDNGSPFGANRGLALSKLSLWWMQLNITHERITPGVPQQNGRHERMHRTLKLEALSSAARNQREQQRRFDAFRGNFNNVRPHEALQMKTPSQVHIRSRRELPQCIPKLTYPKHFETRLIGSNGRLSLKAHSYFITKILSEQSVGLEQLSAAQTRVWAGQLPLGFIDSTTETFVLYKEAEQLTINPLLPMR